MNLAITLLYLLATLFFMFAIQQFMGVFFEKRRTSPAVLRLSYLLYFILAGAERLLFNTMESHMLVVLPLLFLITLNYESSMLKRFAATVSNYVVFSVAVVFVFVPAFLLFHENVFIIEYSLGSLLSLFIATLLKRFKTIKKSNVSTPLFWTLALAVPGSVIIVFIFNSLGFFYITLYAALFFLMAANLLIFFVYESLSAAYEDKHKSVLHAQEKEYYFAQCQTMQESVERMKAFRHDVKIHLAAAKDYAVKGKAAEAAAYLGTLLENISETDTYSETGNIAFDSIINYKLRNAKTQQIELDLTLAVPPVLNMNMVDIVTILGNLLSNALEAVAKVEDRIIKLDIEFSKGCLFIKMENSFDGILNYREDQLISRKVGEEYGYGLQNTKQTIEKYDGYMKISHTDNLFSVVVFLYVEDMKA